MKLLALLLLTTFATSANAAYFPEEDTPSIAAPVAPKPQKKTWETRTLNIPFCTGKKEAGPIATQILTSALPELRRAKEIFVTGRPDKNVDDFYIAGNRMEYLKNWLLKIAGIPEKAIITETHREAIQSPYPTCSISNIRYTTYTEPHTNASTVLNNEPYQPLQEYRQEYRPQGKLPADQISATTIHRIIAVSQIAHFSSTDMARLFENFIVAKLSGLTTPDEQIIIEQASRLNAARNTEMSAIPSRPDQSAALSVAPMPATINAPSIQPQKFFATPNSLIRKNEWTLKKEGTLRDNVNDWSKIAGWNPSNWAASNYYQITTAKTYTGDFPSVLRQIADESGLNICPRKQEKIVHVTDSHISCQ